MPRIRTIKPEFPQSESMGRVSRDARLTFVQMWTLADDSGRLRGNSRMLASLLFPYDDDAPKLIDEWIAELDGEGCLRRYTIGGDSYIEICNWLKHQKIDKPSPSRIPPFDEASRIVAKPRECSSLDQGPRTKEGTKDQGSGGERGGDLPRASRAGNWQAEFSEFWAVYPLHKGKRAAFLAYGRALKRAEHATILAGATRYAADPARKPDFTAHPATWLNQDRWLDEAAETSVDRALKAITNGAAHDDYR